MNRLTDMFTQSDGLVFLFAQIRYNSSYQPYGKMNILKVVIYQFSHMQTLDNVESIDCLCKIK